MTLTVQDLIGVLYTFFPLRLSVDRALQTLCLAAGVLPILLLDRYQRTQRNYRTASTGWLNAAQAIASERLETAIPKASGEAAESRLEDVLMPAEVQAMAQNIAALAQALKPDPVTGLSSFSPNASYDVSSKPILVTSRLSCVFCPDAPLHKGDSITPVKIITSSLQDRDALLIGATCTKRDCHATYYPDYYSRPDPNSDESPSPRMHYLEHNTEWIRISRAGVFAHVSIAKMQQSAMKNLQSGWQQFARFMSELDGMHGQTLTEHQSYRLFAEHFARRLLAASHLEDQFVCPAPAGPEQLVQHVLKTISPEGNGGIVPGAHLHACMDCLHRKRYASDDSGGATGSAAGVATVEGSDATPALRPPNAEEQASVGPDAHLYAPPQAVAPPDDVSRGWVRAVVMDGKTITHRICAVKGCCEPLENYKNGRFCKDHVEFYSSHCGYDTCTLPVEPGSMTCNLSTHKQWYRAYQSRFSRISFAGVKRIIRRTYDAALSTIAGGSAPSRSGPELRPLLPNGVNGETGTSVSHRFRAGKTYCIQTLQYACGVPCGWTKMYGSEAPSQVVVFLFRILGRHPPSYVFYDNSCTLLAHIVTQPSLRFWLRTTRFLCDAWHYINHRSDDYLCRVWCNPAPADGSQPDLVLNDVDDDGRAFSTRAFNTETAEQFNAWLTGHEASLKQMTAFNFDFTVHSLMLIYRDLVEDRIRKKKRYLDGNPDDVDATDDDDDDLDV